jgi:hypothetical protein
LRGPGCPRCARVPSSPARVVHTRRSGSHLASSGPHPQDVIISALETGCRKQELLSLHWQQVDYIVTTKGDLLVAVQREDLDLTTDARAQALAVADNPVGELDLAWDIDMLRQLQAGGFDLAPFWTDEELATLFAEEGRPYGRNAVVEPGATDIVRGELFLLGRHRLLCGDSTSAGDVTRLLDGTRPMLMTTDPPYGASYDPAWRHRANPNQRTTVGRVMNDDRAEWTAA